MSAQVEREIIIPFSGFYNSIHDSNIDSAIEQMFSDDSGTENAGLSARVHDKCNFFYVRLEYAKHYASAFADEFELPSLAYKTTDSPREYNFTTDRIVCTLAIDDVLKIYDETDTATMNAAANAWFTSRDGFISFYSPDWQNEWGDILTWDHNQLACLLSAYVETVSNDEFDQWKENDLMESAQCNGDFDSWISENTDGIERLYKISEYLRTRQARGQK